MDIKFEHFKKRYLILLFISISVLFVSAYWLKIQMGIDFFNSFSLGSHFPLKYLRSDVIESPKPGNLLEENFDKERIFPTWSGFWMQEAGAVTKEWSLDGINGSRCLLIKNTGKGRWAYYHNKRVHVKKGNIFSFKGDVNINGKNLFAYICVAVFDKNKKAISWSLFKKTVNRTGIWVTIEKQFSISDDVINYVTLRLVGVGNGDYRFDNITFRKIK